LNKTTEGKPWEFKTIVQSVDLNSEHIRVSIPPELTQAHATGNKYTVEFEVGLTMFNRQMHAIDRAPALDILFPAVAPVAAAAAAAAAAAPQPLARDSDLNDLQQRAVENILAQHESRAPYVIFGPPGTGVYFQRRWHLVRSLLGLTQEKLAPLWRLFMPC
jgi:hypothetical protein